VRAKIATWLPVHIARLQYPLGRTKWYYRLAQVWRPLAQLELIFLHGCFEYTSVYMRHFQAQCYFIDSCGNIFFNFIDYSGACYCHSYWYSSIHSYIRLLPITCGQAVNLILRETPHYSINSILESSYIWVCCPYY